MKHRAHIDENGNFRWGRVEAGIAAVTFVLILIGWGYNAGILSANVKKNTAGLDATEEVVRNIQINQAKIEKDIEYIKEGIAKLLEAQ